MLVALELADDAIGVEGHEHLAAHLLPCAHLLVAEADLRPQGIAAARGEQLEHRLRRLADPRHHDVRVGVVAQASLGRVRMLLVELVRAHDPVDLPPVALRVVVGDGAPEARDLQQHLGAVVAEELEVVGRVVVAPDVVEDRRVDVALVAAEVRLPASGQRVEVHALGLLVPVAAALPREHGSPAADLARRRARLADPPVAVHEQPPRDLRQPEVEEGIDVELVPEDVPAIGLAVETARRDAGVVMRGEARADLQDVRDVQAQQELGAFVARKADVADLPELLPGPRVTGEGLVERGIARDALDRVRQRLVDRAIP